MEITSTSREAEHERNVGDDRLAYHDSDIRGNHVCVAHRPWPACYNRRNIACGGVGTQSDSGLESGSKSSRALLCRCLIKERSRPLPDQSGLIRMMQGRKDSQDTF